MKNKKTMVKRGIVPGFEEGRYEVRRIQDRREFASGSEEFIRRDNRINIRISSRDLHALQQKALQEGVPTQSLVSSIVQDYVRANLDSGQSGDDTGADDRSVPSGEDESPSPEDQPPGKP